MGLALSFMVLMGVSVLAYVVLDGYDLGVGMLMPAADAQQQSVMVSSIGPFWDANETWLVLGVGLLSLATPIVSETVRATGSRSRPPWRSSRSASWAWPTACFLTSRSTS